MLRAVQGVECRRRSMPLPHCFDEAAVRERVDYVSLLILFSVTLRTSCALVLPLLECGMIRNCASQLSFAFSGRCLFNGWATSGRRAKWDVLWSIVSFASG